MDFYKYIKSVCFVERKKDKKIPNHLQYCILINEEYPPAFTSRHIFYIHADRRAPKS